MEKLYPDVDTSEPVFAQPGPVSTDEQVSHSLPVSTGHVALEPTEEGELSELEDQPDVDTGDSDRAISEDHNYRETVRGLHAFGLEPHPRFRILPGLQDRQSMGWPQSPAS